jgi:hypothetical protein
MSSSNSDANTLLNTRSIVANLSNADRDSAGEELSPIFSNKPLHLFAQSNQYLFKASGSSWHGGNSTHEYVNYFIRHGGQIGNRLVDPTQAVPTFEEIYEPLKSTHARLFAVWLGMNKHKLLVPDEKEAQPAIEAWMLRPERRVFVSTPMFAISVGIICLYTLVTVIVYLRRPGKYLPQMPTSIAALVTLFAASSVVEDMKNTSQLNEKERTRLLEDLDQRYGYGSFVGGEDGRVHIGIEKVPFIRSRAKTGWLDNRGAFLRKRSAT